MTRLTPRQRDALNLLRRCYAHDDGWGVVTSQSSSSVDGQAWIHWATADALEERGLVEVDRSLGRDGTSLKLTGEGFRVSR